MISEGQETLEAHGKDGASFDARALLSFVLGIPFRDIPLKLDVMVTEEQKEKYRELLDERLSGKPLQYITGEQEFMGFSFQVDERVLIPRLDTEILAEEALAYLDEISARADKSASRPFRVLDLCCGSGAIGLSLAALAGNTEVVLSDISKDALQVAELNAEHLGVKDRVSLIRSDLFKETGGGFDLIVSNPPYVRTDVIQTLETEVRDHEPVLALDGGADGLDIYRRIVKEAPEHLSEGGCLMMELGFDQAADLKKLIEEDGRYSSCRVRKDLAGLDRVVIAGK